MKESDLSAHKSPDSAGHGTCSDMLLECGELEETGTNGSARVLLTRHGNFWFAVIIMILDENVNHLHCARTAFICGFSSHPDT